MSGVPVPGWVIERRGVVTSTMDVAAELATAGARDRTAVVADEQTAGRGRAGRTWLAATGTALLMTAIFRPASPATHVGVISIAAGLAVADAIHDVSGLQVWLKWPNDLWIGTRESGEKVAGILVQNRIAGDRVDVALVGTGVNLGPDGVADVAGATTLREHGVEVPRDTLLRAVLLRLDERFSSLAVDSWRISPGEWESRAALIGCEVEVADGDRICHGTLLGIQDDGALLLRDAQGYVVPITVGDVTRGPRRRS